MSRPVASDSCTSRTVNQRPGPADQSRSRTARSSSPGRAVRAIVMSLKTLVGAAGRAVLSTTLCSRLRRPPGGTAVDALDIARWQFGIVTVYHFLFVPITIGLSAVVAWFETAWVRTNKEQYLRLTKFFGKLFLINFAIGVVTGIVQEFQFGMNWSDYSRFVGDIFGAPLAIEGLLAFFLESTFLGLWIFGWGKLPKNVHAATIWAVHIGTLFSSYFILAANSWMQHPVGYKYNPQTGRAELTDFWAVMFNKVQLVTFPHVVTACFVTGGVFVLAISAYHLARGRDVEVFRPSIRIGLVTVLIAGVGVLITGDL